MRKFSSGSGGTIGVASAVVDMVAEAVVETAVKISVVVAMDVPADVVLVAATASMTVVAITDVVETVSEGGNAVVVVAAITVASIIPEATVDGMAGFVVGLEVSCTVVVETDPTIAGGALLTSSAYADSGKKK